MSEGKPQMNERRVNHSCMPKTKEMAYKTLVHPTLEYASSSWEPFQKNHMDRLESVQRKAARFITVQYQRDVIVTGPALGRPHMEISEDNRLEARLHALKTLCGLTACNIPPYITPHNTTNRASHMQQTARSMSQLPTPAPNCWGLQDQHLHKDFVDGRMHMVPPMGHYAWHWPRLGSASSVTVVGPDSGALPAASPPPHPHVHRHPCTLLTAFVLLTAFILPALDLYLEETLQWYDASWSWHKALSRTNTSAEVVR